MPRSFKYGAALCLALVGPSMADDLAVPDVTVKLLANSIMADDDSAACQAPYSCFATDKAGNAGLGALAPGNYTVIIPGKSLSASMAKYFPKKPKTWNEPGHYGLLGLTTIPPKGAKVKEEQPPEVGQYCEGCGVAGFLVSVRMADGTSFGVEAPYDTELSEQRGVKVTFNVPAGAPRGVAISLMGLDRKKTD